MEEAMLFYVLGERSILWFSFFGPKMFYTLMYNNLHNRQINN